MKGLEKINILDFSIVTRKVRVKWSMSVNSEGELCAPKT